MFECIKKDQRPLMLVSRGKKNQIKVRRACLEYTKVSPLAKRQYNTFAIKLNIFKVYPEVKKEILFPIDPRGCIK